jgi:hypothetical protein
MLEIYLIIYLAISIPVTILLLLACKAAKQADRELEGQGSIFPHQQPSREKKHFKKSISSLHF